VTGIPSTNAAYAGVCLSKGDAATQGSACAKAEQKRQRIVLDNFDAEEPRTAVAFRESGVSIGTSSLRFPCGYHYRHAGEQAASTRDRTCTGVCSFPGVSGLKAVLKLAASFSADALCVGTEGMMIRADSTA
jgi:hypothetical protein